MMIVKSLKSQGYLQEVFNWQWSYYTVTNKGVMFLVNYLGKSKWHAIFFASELTTFLSQVSQLMSFQLLTRRRRPPQSLPRPLMETRRLLLERVKPLRRPQEPAEVPEHESNRHRSEPRIGLKALYAAALLPQREPTNPILE